MQPLDLTNCDREPIHIPGSIQPHGILLVVDPNSEVVLQVAGDIAGSLATQHRSLGRPLHDLLGVGLEELTQSAGVGLESKPRYLGAISGPTPSTSVDVLAYMRDGVAVLELESSLADRPLAARLLAEIGAAIAAIDAAPDLLSLCQAAAREVQRITNFDRVMVYHFLEDGSGSVVAEQHVDALPSFLNHRYPASDIPRQARELYVHNPIRVIPDVYYIPIPLVPSLCPVTGQPLDMRDCMLRSVSPTHIQYLKNMGVAASMSVSVIRDGALWGLVACHHRTPKRVPYELREVSRHVGQALAQRIAAREEAEAHFQVRQLDATRDRILSALALADDVECALPEHISDLRSIVSSDGVAVCHRERVVGAGHRPSDAKIRALSQWLLHGGLPDPFITNHLAERYAPASAYRARASGLLATVIRRENPLLLLWFRAEQTEEIAWAGNPHKPVEPGSELGTLNPRRSFKLWHEIVRGRSRLWTDAELEAVRRFRDRVLELHQRQQLSALNQQLRKALSEKEDLLTQKDLLMREVHHRVQNGLQLVNSMLRLQQREAADPVVAAHFAEACRRLTAVALIHQRLRRSDQVQSVAFDSYLGELRVGLVEGWGATWDQYIHLQAAPVTLPTKEAVILALVVTELLTNAVKHAYGGKLGPIRVMVEEQSPKTIRITVEDHGTWAGGREWADGVGSRLVRALLAPLKGKIGFEENWPGLRVILEVPLSTGPV